LTIFSNPYYNLSPSAAASSASSAASAPNQPTGTVRANGGLNLRAGPGSNYDVILVIPDNSTVTISTAVNDEEWYYVAFDGADGWVSKEYVLVAGR
jgi:uncharacterized protein YraI